MDICSSWKIISQPELSWTRVEAVTSLQEDSHNSIFDHTEGSLLGHYLLLKPNKTIPFSNVRIKFNLFFSKVYSSSIYYRLACLLNIIV